jgi:hypothetical protein
VTAFQAVEGTKGNTLSKRENSCFKLELHKKQQEFLFDCKDELVKTNKTSAMAACARALMLMVVFTMTQL